jgi:hypothetical protein
MAILQVVWKVDYWDLLKVVEKVIGLVDELADKTAVLKVGLMAETMAS